MSDSRETLVELITAVLLVVLIAFYFVGLHQGFVILLAGLVLLGSGVYQTRKGWHVSLVTWVLGLILTLAGLGLRLFLVGVLRIDWVPIALLLVAVYFVWSWWHKRP